MLCDPEYEPQEKHDPYVLARLLLKGGADLQPAKQWGFTPPTHPFPEITANLTNTISLLPPMHIALERDNAGLVAFFMKYDYRLSYDDLQFAVRKSAEKSCIALMNWGAFIPTALEQDVGSLFCEAANHHLLGLMWIMIHNNPQYLQLDWVIDPEISTVFCKTSPKTKKLKNKAKAKKQIAKFWAWMRQQRKQPAALTVLCRKTVVEELFAVINQQYLQQDPQLSMLTEHNDGICLKSTK